MHVLVIGGTRFMGPRVVQRLRSRGVDVTVFHRGQSAAELPDGTREIKGDRRKGEELRALRATTPDLVLDMVPIVEQDARDLVDTFRGVARRIVSISSMDVYRNYSRIHGKELGPVDNRPMSEDSPLRSVLHPYRGDEPRTEDDPRKILDDYDKIPIETIIMSEPEPPGTVLRLPMVYGPGDYQHRLYSYVKRIEDRRPYILLEQCAAEVRFARGYTENVADAIALAVLDDRAAGRIYNVADPDTLTELDWVGSIGHALAWVGEVVVLNTELLPEKLRTDMHCEHHLVADTSRIRSELDYEEAISREEAIRETAAWELQHPPEHVQGDDFDYALEDQVLAAR